MCDVEGKVSPKVKQIILLTSAVSALQSIHILGLSCAFVAKEHKGTSWPDTLTSSQVEESQPNSKCPSIVW